MALFKLISTFEQHSGPFFEILEILFPYCDHRMDSSGAEKMDKISEY